MNRLGLVSISFRPKSPEEILIAMQKSGLTDIEWGSDVHAPCNDLNAVRELAELQERYGVRCCSYGTYFRLGITPLAELEQYIEAAKVLGTRILRLWCGNKNSEEYTKEERIQLFEECRQAARIAEKENVILCMECHNNTYTNCKEGALELMEAAGNEYFRMYWQPNQLRSESENMESAKLIAPYTVNIHVFNWKMNGDILEKYPLAGACELWKRYLQYFDGTQALLLEFMPDDQLDSLGTEEAALLQIAE